jgi:hypothetical protein
MERIFPLPEVRNTLIEIFCRPDNVIQAKADKANKDCLVRPLLGRKRFGTIRPGGSLFFSLRNYKLHVDQIKELDHQTFPPGSSTYEHTTNSMPNFKQRLISLWLMDFDACEDITMSDAGVAKEIKAFLETDPSYPRPLSQDGYVEHLWEIFSRRYRETSLKILSGTPHTYWPERFLRGGVGVLGSRQTAPSPGGQAGLAVTRDNLGASSGQASLGAQAARRRGYPANTDRRGGSLRGQLQRGGSSRGGRGRGGRGTWIAPNSLVWYVRTWQVRSTYSQMEVSRAEGVF